VDAWRAFVEDDVGALEADRASQFAQHQFQTGIGFGWRTVDQARGVLGDDMLERRPPSLGERPRPQSAAEIGHDKEQHQGGGVEQPSGSLRARLDDRVAPCELRARRVQDVPARDVEKGLYGGVHGR
jgi:hypothetical protein